MLRVLVLRVMLRVLVLSSKRWNRLQTCMICISPVMQRNVDLIVRGANSVSEIFVRFLVPGSPAMGNVRMHIMSGRFMMLLRMGDRKMNMSDIPLLARGIFVPFF